MGWLGKRICAQGCGCPSTSTAAVLRGDRHTQLCAAHATQAGDAAALQRARQQFSEEIETHSFAQYMFFRQWTRLRQHCTDRRIRIMGDLPIYVAHDSADVWTNPEFFLLDENGNPKKVAGVPPDYFSATGQLWGNPIYNWEKLRETGYRWWIERFRAVFQLFDIVRVDHFRGFEAYWEVPA